MQTRDRTEVGRLTADGPDPNQEKLYFGRVNFTQREWTDVDRIELVIDDRVEQLRRLLKERMREGWQ